MTRNHLGINQAFELLHAYLPVAFSRLEATGMKGMKNLYKIQKKIDAGIQNQPLEDVTVALVIALTDVVNFLHKKHPLRKQRKAARKAA